VTPQQSGVVLDALVAAFPRTMMSEETVRMYARFLVDFELEHAVAAVAKWIAREQRFPVIAELREACAAAAGSGPPDADLAFAEVMRAVGSLGIYGEPKWSHGAIREAVDAITWREVCMSEHAPSLRKHFADAYATAKKRRTDPGHAALVAGVVSELKQRLLASGDTAALPDAAKVKS
jgi:hypothetical protein